MLRGGKKKDLAALLITNHPRDGALLPSPAAAALVDPCLVQIFFIK
jgi:hypothetical protein